MDPTLYGDWEVRCFSGISSDGQRRCFVDRRKWTGVQRGDVLMINIAREGEQDYVKVRTAGYDAATCLRVELTEFVPLASLDFRHQSAGTLSSKVMKVLQSHFQLVAICDSMGRRVSNAPTGELEASAPDLQRALNLWEER